jgi:hypothetical protein
VSQEHSEPEGLKRMTAQFTTETFSSLALADLPGQLGYLPGSWRRAPPAATAIHQLANAAARHRSFAVACALLFAPRLLSRVSLRSL